MRERRKLLKREREKDKESIRTGKERKSPGKTNVPKLYAYNECEHSVERKYPAMLVKIFSITEIKI